MLIVGMKIEKYIDKGIKGHNCNFDYFDKEFERYIILGVLDDNRKVEIILTKTEGECYSGWCVASWGNIEVREVRRFEGYSFVPKEKIIIDDIDPNNYEEEYSNKLFYVSKDGGDEYYPCGSFSVAKELFKRTNRYKDSRPVWVFKGESNSGKSFLSSKLSRLKVYETDSCPYLPQVIVEDVIVLGNKYNFSINDIKNQIPGNFELTIVDFSIEKNKVKRPRKSKPTVLPITTSENVSLESLLKTNNQIEL